MDALLHKPSKIEIQVKEITLPSVEEIEEEERKPDNGILASTSWWWLRSHSNAYDTLSDASKRVATVCMYGAIYRNGDTVDTAGGGIRPVLRIMNDESQKFEVGDKITVAGKMWTAIKPDLFLCDKIVGRSCFREDRRAEDANDYEKSDIKKWLHNWAIENGIEIQQK